MTVPNVGDFVELMWMPADADPIAVGTRGEVTAVRCHPGWLPDGGDWHQVDVDWEDGRQLMLSIPPDTVRVIRP